jgi:hypothetical protein
MRFFPVCVDRSHWQRNSTRSYGSIHQPVVAGLSQLPRLRTYGPGPTREDSANDVGWGPLAWCNRGSCHHQGVTSTTPQSQVGCDLGMVTQDGHILDEKCKDLLTLAVDDAMMVGSAQSCGRSRLSERMRFCMSTLSCCWVSARKRARSSSAVANSAGVCSTPLRGLRRPNDWPDQPT